MRLLLSWSRSSSQVVQTMRSPLSTQSGGRVLSIQSHVVHGHVGNKAAVLPLQLCGFDVDVFNTVQFSTHSGRPHVKGSAATAEQLQDIAEGLRLNHLLNYNYVLSGYARGAPFLEALADLVRELRAESGASYFLDPVLGDNGRLYVPEACVTVYREQLLPLATVTTPNQFEAEVLTGVQIRTRADAVRACAELHRRGVRTAVISSLELEDNSTEDNEKLAELVGGGPAGLVRNRGPWFGLMASTIDHGATLSEPLVYQVPLPKLSGSFSGCGDLMSALLLATMHAFPDDLPTALERACAAVHTVLVETMKTGSGSELQLVRCRHALAAAVASAAGEDATATMEAPPPVLFQAEAVKENGIDAVLFDMDGTLTLPGHINFQAMRERIGLPPGLDILSQIAELPIERQAAALDVVRQEEMAALAHMELQPGLADVMADLRRQRIRCAICTRNQADAVSHFMDTSGLPYDVFSAVLTRDFKYNKPDGRVAAAVAATWRIQPANMLFVGDHRDDLACGKDAGCFTCLVVNDENRHYLEEERDLIDYSITSLSELPAVLAAAKRQMDKGGTSN